ncbi:ABC transporter substrate-binding protein [Thalassococcus sp. S3]|uniref:ABC transporter substrate-binding protein n=1 Tax=Thalassococcus sp. S3 TaxID=2017482 RepID=UPI0010242806|nr:ABC transporter substrate-binding protein [Thalassococcus sp. S3]QBF34102.1 peptide ABC transporter substrate-binding protein [Thalassococcus sp. S3]
MTRIDRRALFTSGAAAALLAATGVSLEAAPQSGGKLRLAVPRSDDGVLPAMQGAVFDTLTEVAPNGVLQAELALSWQSDDAARVWDFVLREGVRFHDGSLLNPEHVVAALGDHYEIAQTGASALRLTLDQSDPHLPYRLADPAASVARGGDIGTGLYRVERHQPGRHFLGKRVAEHYKDGTAGWFDAVEIIAIPDPEVRAEALRDGFVDVAQLPSPQGLRAEGGLIFHPSADDMALATHADVGLPKVIGAQAPLDNGRIAERWWMRAQS